MLSSSKKTRLYETIVAQLGQLIQEASCALETGSHRNAN